MFGSGAGSWAMLGRPLHLLNWVLSFLLLMHHGKVPATMQAIKALGFTHPLRSKS